MTLNKASKFETMGGTFFRRFCPLHNVMLFSLVSILGTWKKRENDIPKKISFSA